MNSNAPETGRFSLRSVFIASLVLGLIAMPLLMGVGCIRSSPISGNTTAGVGTQKDRAVKGGQGISEKQSQEIARDFVRNSPTFQFDGIQNSLKLLESKAESGARWMFVYKFQCRHAGYGDRSGKMLAQVITDHKAEIVVEKGKVVHAILDGKWDMLEQDEV